MSKLGVPKRSCAGIQDDATPQTHFGVLPTGDTGGTSEADESGARTETVGESWLPFWSSLSASPVHGASRMPVRTLSSTTKKLQTENAAASQIEANIWNKLSSEHYINKKDT